MQTSFLKESVSNLCAGLDVILPTNRPVVLPDRSGAGYKGQVWNPNTGFLTGHRGLKMNEAEARLEIEQLRRTIERHNHLYYVLNQPEVTDEAYDALMRRLAELEQAFPHLTTPESPTQRVGSTPAEVCDRSTSHSDALVEQRLQHGGGRGLDARIRRMLNVETLEYAEPRSTGWGLELRRWHLQAGPLEATVSWGGCDRQSAYRALCPAPSGACEL